MFCVVVHGSPPGFETPTIPGTAAQSVGRSAVRVIARGNLRWVPATTFITGKRCVAARRRSFLPITPQSIGETIMMKSVSLPITALVLVLFAAVWLPPADAAIFPQPAPFQSSQTQSGALNLANADSAFHVHSNAVVHAHEGGAQPHGHEGSGSSSLAFAALILSGLVVMLLAARRRARRPLLLRR